MGSDDTLTPYTPIHVQVHGSGQVVSPVDRSDGIHHLLEGIADQGFVRRMGADLICQAACGGISRRAVECLAVAEHQLHIPPNQVRPLEVALPPALLLALLQAFPYCAKVLHHTTTAVSRPTY